MRMLYKMRHHRMDCNVTMGTEPAMKVESGEKDLNYFDEYVGKLRDEG